jgi:hypothetical protein
MQKTFWLLVTALLTTTLTVTGYAAEEAKKGAAEQATTAAAGTGSMMGEHDMTGTIERIDHKTGVVKVAAKPHDLELHFPPDSIKDLKKGDKITVHLGFQKD